MLVPLWKYCLLSWLFVYCFRSLEQKRRRRDALSLDPEVLVVVASAWRGSCRDMYDIYIYIYIYRERERCRKRRGRVLLTDVSSCSTGNCLSSFSERINAKSSNWEIRARWGFPLLSSPLLVTALLNATDRGCCVNEMSLRPGAGCHNAAGQLSQVRSSPFRYPEASSPRWGRRTADPGFRGQHHIIWYNIP